jgi:hypothetical protein
VAQHERRCLDLPIGKCSHMRYMDCRPTGIIMNGANSDCCVGLVAKRYRLGRVSAVTGGFL